jgi:hypothetical protein
MHELVSQTKQGVGRFKTMMENQQAYLNRRELHSSGLLRSQYWQFLTNALGQAISPIFKDRESKKEAYKLQTA